MCLEDPSMNILRVQNRKGGHDVPRQKIIDRYHRTLENLPSALQISRKTYLFDNSDDHMVLIAEVIDGQIALSVTEDQLPNWFIEHVINKQ